MIKEGKIGIQEAIALTTLVIAVKIYFIGPSDTIRHVGTATWYMTIISTSTAIIGFLFMYLLLKRFPNKDLIYAFENSFGRVLGFVVCMIFSLYLLISSSILIREFSEVAKIYVLPETPLTFHIFFQLSVMAFVTFLGFETIVRFAKLASYFILFSFIILLALNFNHIDFNNIYPILGHGIEPIAKYGLSECSFYGEVAIIGLIAETLQDTKNIKKIGIVSLIISGLLISIAYLTAILVLRDVQSQEPTSLMYTLTTMIQIGFFFNRLDPIFILPWGIGTLISVTALFYCSLSTYCKVFRIQDMRPVIVPGIIILFSLSMLPKDVPTLLSYISSLRHFGFIIFFGLPLIALVVAIFRKKGGSMNA